VDQGAEASAPGLKPGLFLQLSPERFLDFFARLDASSGEPEDSRGVEGLGGHQHLAVGAQDQEGYFRSTPTQRRSEGTEELRIGFDLKLDFQRLAKSALEMGNFFGIDGCIHNRLILVRPRGFLLHSGNWPCQSLKNKFSVTGNIDFVENKQALVGSGLKPGAADG
jgi:hypothetical protein